MPPMRYRIVKNISLAILIACGLAGCSDQGSSERADWYRHNSLYDYSGQQGNFWNHMRSNLHMNTYTYTPAVRQEIYFFQHHQDYLNHVLVESAPYIYYIYQQTQARHLPAELALIPVIESEYNPYARSNVGATGLWQMMPGTAQGFGLKRDRWYDGRRDVVASTNAALEYFKYLHSFFNNDWLLAIAAYDCGEGTVMQCIHYNQYHGDSTNFWNLPLPYETRGYVPRLLAVAAIIKNPQRYHITLVPINDGPYAEPINVGRPIALSKAAKLADVPLATMRVLNPGIQHDSAGPRDPDTILVPSAKADTFRIRLAALSQHERLAWQEHIVKSKETLQKIATHYRTTVAMLRKINGLTSDKVEPNETILVPPLSQPDQATDSTSSTLAFNKPNADSDQIANNNDADDANNNGNTASTNTNANIATDAANPQPLVYTVKPGDDLWKVAKKYHVTMTELRTWNHLSRHHRLRHGETLVVNKPADATASTTTVANNANTNTDNTIDKTTATSNSDSNTPNNSIANNNAVDASPSNDASQALPISYEVKAGEDLHKIATRFHTTTAELRHANHLSSNKIQVGKTIIIPADDNHFANSATNTTNSSVTTASAQRQITYTIRNGDYIEKIAKRYHVSTDDLKKWNQISEDTILQPGEKIVIFRKI